MQLYILERKMRKKQNVYKRKRDFHIFRTLSTVLFSVILVSFFALIGYSVAKPFGKVGEAKNDSSYLLDLDEFSAPSDDLSDTNSIRAYWLSETEIKDIETLERMLDRIGDTYNTAVIPLKISGGKLNYNSVNDGAAMADVNSEIEIGDIIKAVKERGFKPAASLNTLNDNLYPKADKSSGFVYKDTGKLWYDDNEKKGGKAWLSPSASSTGTYLSSLTTEIASAGFEYIIATDAEYPQFSRIGLDAIGESVTNENRYLDLINVVNKTAAAAKSKNSEMWIEISAKEMFEGTCEVFQPIMLETDKTVLEINLDDFSGKVKCGSETVDFSGMSAAEKVEKVCDIAETYIYKTSFIPEITGKNLSTSDKNAAIESLKNMKYDSYIVR